MIAHKVVGAGQLVVVQLDAGQAVWCQPGRFAWKTPNVTVQPRLIGPGGERGLLDRTVAMAIAAGRRRLAGGAAAFPYFSASRSSGLVAFAGEPAGEIRELRVEPGSGWLVARWALVAAEGSVGVGAAPAGAVGEASGGFDQLGGNGSAFVTGSGGLLEVDVGRHGGAVDVDAGRLVALREGVRVEPRKGLPLGGDELLAALLGGGRQSLATVRGDGAVLLQAAPVSAAAPAGTPLTHQQGGSDGIQG